MIRNIDKRIIDWLQMVYLWLYDWTGIYAASVGILAFLIGKGVAGFRLDATSLFLTGLNIIVMVPNYLSQDRGNYTRHNLVALELRRWGIRIVFICMMFVILILEMLALELKQAFYSVMLIIYMYMPCMCIRDREPKEWFKKHRLATQSTS